MTKARQEFTLKPENIDYIKKFGARKGSMKVDEAIELLRYKEVNKDEEKPLEIKQNNDLILKRLRL